MKKATVAKLGLATIVIAIAGGSCISCKPARVPSTEPPDLTVMTYNVNFGLAGDDAEVEAIRAGGADVVFLQETNTAWERTFRAALGSEYPHMTFHDPQGWPASGMGVMSKWPVEIADVSPSAVGTFYAWRAIVHAPRGDVQVLNVHLRPQVSDSGSFVSGRFVTPAMRKKEMEQHVALLDPTLPTLALGDFNEEDGEALGLLEQRGMVNALPLFQPKATTWRWPVLSGAVTLRQRFDHVLIDRNFRVLDAKALDQGNSDHIPVLVRLKWRLHLTESLP